MNVWYRTAAIDILFFFGTNLFLVENVFPLRRSKANLAGEVLNNQRSKEMEIASEREIPREV